MGIDVTVHTHIARSPEDVASFASDPDNDTAWIVNIKEVRWLTERPAAIGTRVARVARFLGKELAYTYVVDQLVPGERLAMRAVDGPFPMTTTYTWAADGEGTRMSIEVGGGPGGFFGLAAPLLEAQMRRALTADLARLKEILENA